MNNKQQPQQMNINVDLNKSQAIKSPEGNQLFGQAVVLRKISKFITGTSEDAVVPIPVFYDIATGKVLLELLPKELKEEFASEQE